MSSGNTLVAAILGFVLVCEGTMLLQGKGLFPHEMTLEVDEEARTIRSNLGSYKIVSYQGEREIRFQDQASNWGGINRYTGELIYTTYTGRETGTPQLHSSFNLKCRPARRAF